MRPFTYDAKKKSKKWEVTAEMREKELLLKIEQYFSPAEAFCSYQGVLYESALKDNPPKMRLRDKQDRSAAQDGKRSISKTWKYFLSRKRWPGRRDVPHPARA